MMKLYEIRSVINAFYQKYQSIINIVGKFVISLITFMLINNAIGYDVRFGKLPVVMLLALLCAFTPSSVLVLLAMAVSLAHVYHVSKFLVIIVAVIFVILYCLFFRFVPQYGVAVVALPICTYLGIPYIVPLILGLFANPVSILSIVCGAVVYNIFHIIAAEAETVAESINDALALYTRVLDALVANKEMYATIAVFALVIIAVYIVKNLKISYAFEISIAAGTIVSIIGMLIVHLKLDVNGSVSKMVLMTIFCAVLAFIIEFFRRVLDYTAIENVQFEDDDYYYYVKAVPKINLSAPKINVKRITAKESEDDILPEEISDASENGEKNVSIVGLANARKQAREGYKEEDVDFTVDTSGIDIDEERGR